MPTVPSYYVGWQKSFLQRSEIEIYLHRSKTVILAPTEIAYLNWQPILKGLSESGRQVLIKNHIYWDYENDEPAPRGQEEKYLQHRYQLEALERYVYSVNSKNLVLI